jgi:TolB-like protein
LKEKAITSLAVLPILDSSADPGAKHLVNGLAENIVNGLSVIPDLQVKACSTLVRYKRREINPQKVGRELGVEAILIGRVSQNGDDVIIRIELVDVRNGWQLWGKRYHEKLSNIFGAQEAIARNISKKLRSTLRTATSH